VRIIFPAFFTVRMHDRNTFKR